MDIADLVRAFSIRDLLPVDVNDVLACLRENGNDDSIEFIGVDYDPDVLQGQIKIWHDRVKLYGEPKRFVNIYYHKGHNADWQRMICCKELIHLLDPPSAHTTSAQDIDRLAEKIGLPPEMQDPLNDGLATNVDRMAEFRALALLLPLAARDLLIEPYERDVLKNADIARLADIPTRYVGLAMHEGWPEIHELLTRS